MSLRENGKLVLETVRVDSLWSFAVKGNRETGL